MYTQPSSPFAKKGRIRKTTKAIKVEISEHTEESAVLTGKGVKDY